LLLFPNVRPCDIYQERRDRQRNLTVFKSALASKRHVSLPGCVLPPYCIALGGSLSRCRSLPDKGPRSLFCCLHRPVSSQHCVMSREALPFSVRGPRSGPVSALTLIWSVREISLRLTFKGPPPPPILHIIFQCSEKYFVTVSCMPVSSRRLFLPSDWLLWSVLYIY
jgi:hypothetical protein